METVRYEFGLRFGDLLLLLIPLLVGLGFWLVSCQVSQPASQPRPTHDHSVRRTRDLTGNPAVKWFLRGVAIFCSVLFVGVSISYLSDFLYLKERYENGDYLTVEGYVQSLTTVRFPDKGGDRFEIDGVEFAYSQGDASLHGYRREAQHGGVVPREGQYLVIRYIPDPYTEINHILYIAEKEAP